MKRVDKKITKDAKEKNSKSETKNETKKDKNETKKDKAEIATLCFFKHPLFQKDKIEIFRYDKKKNIMQLVYKK
jgi:hypothetical protein